MTADQQEREIHGMLKFMRDWDYIINCQRDMCDPRFMPPFEREDADTGHGTCEPCPTFPRVTLTLSPYDIVRIADKQEEE